jgi:hypothetical protein
VLISSFFTATTFLFLNAATKMVAKTQEPFFQGSTGKNTRGVLRIVILCLIAAAAIASRLFSVIRTYSKIRAIRMLCLDAGGIGNDERSALLHALFSFN